MSDDNLNDTLKQAERLLSEMEEADALRHSTDEQPPSLRSSAKTSRPSLTSILLASAGVIMFVVSIGILIFSLPRNHENVVERESPLPATSRSSDDTAHKPSAPEPEEGHKAATRRALQPAPFPPPLALARLDNAPAPGTEMIDSGTSSIHALYNDLSSKDFTAAAQYYSPAVQSQFDPTFFSRFDRVTVSGLREQSITGSIVNLIGVNTYVWPDGSVQTERRTYSVDLSLKPAMIIASEFVEVIKLR